MDNSGTRGGDTRVLPVLRDAEAGADGGVRLEPFADGVWFWGYNGEEGLAENAHEGILAIGRAVGRRYGPEAQKKFLLEFIGSVVNSECDRHQ